MPKAFTPVAARPAASYGETTSRLHTQATSGETNNTGDIMRVRTLNTRQTRKRVLATVIAVTAIIGLAGCAPYSPTAVTPTHSATPAPVAYAAGTVVTAGVKLPDTQKAYPMADGTFVIVDNTKPIPATVVADVIAGAGPAKALNIIPINPAHTSEASDQNRAAFLAGIAAMKTYMETKKADLGTDIVLVYQVMASDSNGSYTTWITGSSRGNTGIHVGELDPTVASAQAWAATADARVIVIK